jgi:hypothetical protein
MTQADTNSQIELDPAALALRALVWTLSDEARASRLLALTGLTAERLRAGITDRSVLAAVVGFLEDFEPDLLECAEYLDCSPADLVAARKALEE